MNLFVLHYDPNTAASYMCDRHICKMLVEYAQILYAVLQHHWQQTMPDVNRRNAEIADLQRILKEETIYVPLHVQSISHAMRGGLQMQVHPDAQAWFKYFRFVNS